MANTELSKKWWDQNKPECLKKSEVDKCISKYEKSVVVAAGKKWKIDGALFESAVDSIDATMKAVDKDLAETKKAKDAEGEKLLRGVQQDLESKKAEADKFTQIKKSVDTPASASASGGQPPGAAVAGPGGVAVVVDQIINAASKAWSIVKDGKPALTNDSKFCQAMPKDFDFREYSGWKTTSKSHAGHVENFFGMKGVEYDLTVTFQHHGSSLRTGGFFLNNFTIFCKKIDVEFGFKCDIQAVAGSPFNSGKRAFPIGAIPLVLSITTSGSLKTSTSSTKYTAHGNGLLES
jgi:hypothetical protein